VPAGRHRSKEATAHQVYPADALGYRAPSPCATPQARTEPKPFSLRRSQSTGSLMIQALFVQQCFRHPPLGRFKNPQQSLGTQTRGLFPNASKNQTILIPRSRLRKPIRSQKIEAKLYFRVVRTVPNVTYVHYVTSMLGWPRKPTGIGSQLISPATRISVRRTFYRRHTALDLYNHRSTQHRIPSE
jgi:hypothetical protein